MRRTSPPMRSTRTLSAASRARAMARSLVTTVRSRRRPSRRASSSVVVPVRGEPGPSLPRPVAFTTRDPGGRVRMIASVSSGRGVCTYSIGRSKSCRALISRISARRPGLRLDTTMRAGRSARCAAPAMCDTRAMLEPPAPTTNASAPEPRQLPVGRKSSSAMPLVIGSLTPASPSTRSTSETRTAGRIVTIERRFRAVLPETTTRRTRSSPMEQCLPTPSPRENRIRLPDQPWSGGFLP